MIYILYNWGNDCLTRLKMGKTLLPDYPCQGELSKLLEEVIYYLYMDK